MLIVRCHIQFPTSFGVIGHFLMREIYKRNMEHALYLISKDQGPFSKEEYDYLLDHQITEYVFNKIIQDQSLLSVTTVPITRPKPKYQLLYTDFEGSRIPKFYRDSTDKADLILVPSKFARQSFIAGRSKAKLAVVCHGVEPSILPIQEPSGKFTFLCIAIDDWRKALDKLVTAFRQEFTVKEANLKIRTSAEIPTAKNIIIDNTPIPFSKMGDMYKDVHAFVLPTRGEGFCLPALEALASGLPIIITNVGGHLDYLEDDYFPIEIEGTVLRPQHDHIPDYQFIKYSEPSLTSLRSQMRFVYDNWDHARNLTLRGTLRVRQLYTWSHTLDTIEELVKNVSR